MSFVVHEGNALAVLRTLPAESVNCCVTSPPYWGLRDYGTGTWEGGDPECDHKQNHGVQGTTGQRARRTFTAQSVYREECGRCGGLRVDQQIGLERTPEEYCERIVELFREVRRVLRDDGTLWMNLGDSYANDGKWGGETGGKQAYLPDRKRVGREKRTTGLKSKDLVGIPWRAAFALQADGWYLRSDIIWHKPNPMPESVTDRPTKAHEYLFLLVKSERYHYDAEAIKEPTTGSAHDRARKDRAANTQKSHPTAERNGIRPHGVNPKSQKWPNAWSAEDGRHDGVGDGRFRPKQNESFSAAVTRTVERRNRRTVWKIPTQPFPEAHFATYPEALVTPCILAGCPEGGTVLDPFSGAGTTGLVAVKNGRDYIGIELKPEYAAMSRRRIEGYLNPREIVVRKSRPGPQPEPDQVGTQLTLRLDHPGTNSILS